MYNQEELKQLGSPDLRLKEMQLRLQETERDKARAHKELQKMN